MITPEGWQAKTLHEVATINYGKSPAAILSTDGIYPVVGTGGVERLGKDYLYDGDSIILGRKGTIDRVCFIEGKFWTIDTAYYLSDFIDTSPRWLFYFFQNIDLRQMNEATGVPSLSRERLYKITIKTPPEEQQTQIATVLSTVDRAIAKTEALIAKQQRIKTGLMQDLLTKGIDENGNIRSETTHRFKDSPLGRIPEEWEVSSVETEFDIQTGFTLGEHRRPRRNTHQYLRVANVQREQIVLNDLAEIEVEENELRDRVLEANDLLVVEGHANPKEIGRCAIVEDAAVGLTFQNHLFRLRARRLDPFFCLMWLNSHWVQAYWENICGTSSGLNTINQKMLKAMWIPVPSPAEELRIYGNINMQKKFIGNILNDINALKRLKTGLMQDLLTGKTSVLPLFSN